jgi:hypothetical protein
MLSLPSTFSYSRPRKIYNPSVQLSTSLRNSLSASFNQRVLQDDASNTNVNNTTDACSICGEHTLLEDAVPMLDPYPEDIPANLTCKELNNLALAFPNDSEECSSIEGAYIYCCDGYTVYECERKTRKAILTDDYDTAVPPLLRLTSPLVIDVTLIFQTVTSVNSQDGTAEIYVFLDLTWKDPRLAWDIGKDYCASLVNARASLDVEKSELWVPDFDLYNQVAGVQQFPDAIAEVSSDGTVFWRRAGLLIVICQFSGLSQIPFDTLGCQLLFGPITRMDSQQIVYAFDETTGGLEIGGFVPTYNEFQIVPDETENGKDQRGILFYTFYFVRSKKYYVFNIVVPTIILTFVSFGTFLLDFRVGERLSYGMALTLVIVAQQIVTGDLVPVSNERLWIDKFVGWSFYWVIFGLIESVCVGYIFFIRQDNDVATKDERTPNDELSGCDDNAPDHDEAAATAVEAASESQPRRTSSFKQKLRFLPREKGQSVSCAPKWFHTVDLRKFDHFCFFFSLITYAIFVVCMFATVPLWGRNSDPVYITDDK